MPDIFGIQKWWQNHGKIIRMDPGWLALALGLPVDPFSDTTLDSSSHILQKRSSQVPTCSNFNIWNHQHIATRHCIHWLRQPIGPTYRATIGPIRALSLPLAASLVVLKAIDHQTIGVASGVRNIRQIPGTGPLETSSATMSLGESWELQSL